MNVTLSPELEKQIAEKVERGDAGTVDALVEEALRLYLEYGASQMEGADFHEAQAAIHEALEQGKRGASRPAEDVFTDLRARHGLAR